MRIEQDSFYQANQLVEKAIEELEISIEGAKKLSGKKYLETFNYKHQMKRMATLKRTKADLRTAMKMVQNAEKYRVDYYQSYMDEKKGTGKL